MLRLYSALIFLGGSDLIDSEKTESEIDLSLIEMKRFRLHKKVEGRVNNKKVKKFHGYTCKACNFDFHKTYGELGKEYIEAHHLIPYSELGQGQLRKLNIEKDFVVLCANCHKMIHRMESPDDVSGLKERIVKSSSNG